MTFTINDGYARSHLPNPSWTYEVSARQDHRKVTCGLLWTAYRKTHPNLCVFAYTLRALKFNIHRAMGLEVTHGEGSGFVNVDQLRN